MIIEGVNSPSGKCVYQAQSSHSILSDVSLGRVNTLTFLIIRRHTNEILFTSMTHTRHLCLTTTGKFQVVISRIRLDPPRRLKVPAIRSVLDYTK